MAEEINIEFEDEDDDELLNRLNQEKEDGIGKNQEQPKTKPQIDNDVNINPNATKFDPTGRSDEKEKQKELEKQLREQDRQRKQEIADRLREQRRQAQDQDRKTREQRRDELAAAKSQRTDIRSDAVNDRVQSYAGAAALGLPGYVIASAIDTLFIRPNEQKRLDANQEYQKQLADYYRQVQEDQIKQRRQQEDNIRNTPVDAVPLGRPETPPQTVPPTQSSGGAGVPPRPPGPPGSGPGTGSNLPIPYGGKPGTPPTQAGKVPPPIKPQVPNIPGSIGAGIAIPLQAASTALQVAQQLNNYVQTNMQNIGKTGSAIASNDRDESFKSTVTAVENVLDPLDTNILGTVVVQGFTSLLDINKGILDSMSQNLGFAPQSLEATIERDLLGLMNQINEARRLDPLVAEITKQNTLLDREFSNIRVQFLESIGPEIIIGLKTLVRLLRGLQKIGEAGEASFSVMAPVTSSILELMSIWITSQETKIDPNVDLDILKQIERFFDTDLTIGKSRKGTIPNI